ncbi:MAG: type 4a pilus biogenesis protein PilO [Proteobacteria bacterium]|nr:type 4a pilus biogenesis protein PilO [Pseudomonadota bacterium]
MEELLERYKSLPIPVRILGAVVLSSFIIWTMLLGEKYQLAKDELDGLQTSLESSNNELDRSQKTLESGKTESDLEAELDLLEQKFEQAKNSLPTEFFIDKILKDISRFAEYSGIKVDTISPQDENVQGGDYQYYEIPIDLTITGTYEDCGRFYSFLAQLETMVHIRNISMTQTEIVVEGDDTQEDENESYDSFERKLAAARASYQVESKSTMVLFRSS